MDPSLTSWGYALGRLDPVTMKLHFTDLHVVKTEPYKEKQVRKNSDDIQRASVLAKHAFMAAEHGGIIFVEVPTGGQSYRSAISYATCVGVLGALRAKNISFIEVTPKQLKLATVGKETASKAEIIERAMRLYPEANWPMQTKKGVTSVVTTKAEHMADAIGAVEAGILTNEFRHLMALSQQLS